MSRVAIKEEVLRWAVNRAGLTLDDLQRKVPKIKQWADGESKPTLRQLEKLAKYTLTPLGYFFLGEPPQDRLPISHFRTHSEDNLSGPSPDLIETIQIMQRRQSWMREFMIEQGQERLLFVRSANPKDSHVSAAEYIRHALNFEEGWASRQKNWEDALSILRESMEKIGILVVVNGIVGNNTHRKLDPGEFRGFVLVDEYAPLVFVNNSDGKAAQMFTLAHELAHVFFGSSAAFDLREMQPADDPIEQKCNRVAAEFLVPERELRKIWSSVRSDPEPFQTLARQFKVSVLVAARRAFDLSLINKKEFLEFYRNYQSSQRHLAEHKPEGGDFYANQNLRVGRRFASAVTRAAREGKLLFSEAYQLTGLYGKTFDQYTSTLHIGGIQ